MAKRRNFGNADVAAVFAAYPRVVREKLLRLRELIFEVAAQTDGVRELEETLKWGQPSYLTTQSKSGSLIRIDRLHDADGYAMYFHCQTTLVHTFKERYPDQFEYGGNRSLIFRTNQAIPVAPLRDCIALALTYHRDKKPADRATAREPVKRAAKHARKIASLKPKQATGKK